MTSSLVNRATFTLVLLAAALVGGPLDGQKPEARDPSAEKPLFLDVFRARAPAVVAQSVEWVSAVGKHRGWLVRPETTEQLPILLLVANGPADEFAMQTSRELAGIGYAVLVTDLKRNTVGAMAATAGDEQHDLVVRERGLAQLCAAARWIRRRNDVLPDKVGALGWGSMGRWALEVAAAQGFQAAVLADVDLPLLIDAPLSVGLQHTTVFIVRGAADASVLDGELFARLTHALGDMQIEHQVLTCDTANKGFMDSRQPRAFHEKAADHAWFEMYEFLGKYVEDAELLPNLGAGPRLGGANSAHPFVSIGDVMRAVNGPTAVYGAVAEMLRGDSLQASDWILLRSRAAVIADSGVSLMALTPPRGIPARFRQHAASYRDAAVALIKSADRHDLAEARHAFDRLNTSCRKCHADHR
jgi:dienelactone hydrolase